MSANLETAKASFLALTQSLGDQDRAGLLVWLRDVVLPEVEQSKAVESRIAGRLVLAEIATDLRGHVPLEGVLPSEQIFGTDVQNQVHLDAFLFDEEEEERLVEEGKLARSYCLVCGSRKTAPLKFITHSCSRRSLEFIFSTLLPPLEKKRVLDVGSRLGAVLYAAYLFSDAAEIIGIEMNPDFCHIANKTVDRRAMNDRVRILHAELTTAPDLVRSCDVVILNNVFDCFLPKAMQENMWNFLYENIHSGALIVANPSIEESFKNLNVSIQIDKWVTKLQPYRPGNTSARELAEESEETFLYQVKK